MATLVLTNAYVVVATVDLSDSVQSVSLTFEAEQQDETAMGDTTRIMKAGLFNWNASITFLQDYAAADVDATLFAQVGAAAFVLGIQAVNNSGTGTATNPYYNGNVVLASYAVLGNSVGDLATATAEFQAAGALTRAVA